MNILIISVGKKHSKQLEDAINDYTGRVGRYTTINWEYIKPSGLDEPEARKLESDSIISRLNPNDAIWLLDERGKMISSPALANMLNEQISNSKKRLVIIIGGAYGVDDKLRGHANFVWSLSELVFPHQIVRLIAIEQMYRAYSILNGGKYHHQ